MNRCLHAGTETDGALVRNENSTWENGRNSNKADLTRTASTPHDSQSFGSCQAQITLERSMFRVKYALAPRVYLRDDFKSSGRIRAVLALSFSSRSRRHWRLLKRRSNCVHLQRVIHVFHKPILYPINF